MSESANEIVGSDEQLLELFKTAKGQKHEQLRQDLVHTLVYLAKRDKVLPFQHYNFSRYFTPFSRYLQEDLDDAMVSNLLDGKITRTSAAQWEYWITPLGTSRCEKIIEPKLGKEVIKRVEAFFESKLSQPFEALFIEAYNALDQEIAAAIRKT